MRTIAIFLPFLFTASCVKYGEIEQPMYTGPSSNLFIYTSNSTYQGWTFDLETTVRNAPLRFNPYTADCNRLSVFEMISVPVGHGYILTLHSPPDFYGYSTFTVYKYISADSPGCKPIDIQ